MPKVVLSKAEKEIIRGRAGTMTDKELTALLNESRQVKVKETTVTKARQRLKIKKEGWRGDFKIVGRVKPDDADEAVGGKGGH